MILLTTSQFTALAIWMTIFFVPAVTALVTFGVKDRPQGVKVAAVIFLLFFFTPLILFILGIIGYEG